MDQLFQKPQYNFNMDESKSIILTISDNQSTPESYPASDHGGSSIGQHSVFSPLAPPFQSRLNKDYGSMVAPPEPQVGDTAPSVDFGMMNASINDSDPLFDNRSERNYYMGSRTESVASGNVWADKPVNKPPNKNNENFEIFDFFVKTLSAANAYASILNSDQLLLLRSIRASLLYDFLQEVVKIHQDIKRNQRNLPRECAFCKNNGDSEEKYTSHALKDCKGRVLCPVLRAFSCPRCGATGDRAHTIKYCPTNDNGMDRPSLLRRRASVNSYSYLFNDGSRGSFRGPPNPPQSPSSAFNESIFSSN